MYRKEKYFLTTVDKRKEYKISPFTYTGGYIKEKNALEIVDDSIHVSVNKFPLTELSKYLKLHFENNGKVEYLSDSYKRAFIKLVLEKDNDGIKLKNLLLNVVKTYNETNIKHKKNIDLAIMFDYSLDEIVSIPSPPISIVIEK